MQQNRINSMNNNKYDEASLKFLPLTPVRWSDFETVIGIKGGCGGCWCMWYRIKRTEYEKQKGEGNKKQIKAIVNSGIVPGILGYINDQPVAWCSVARRDDFPVLDGSRILKPIDNKFVWSIVCLFIIKPLRRSGMAEKLVKAAIEWARANGAKIIEGYPIDTHKPKYPDVFAHTGFYSTFKKLKFQECLRRSKTRPIMRLYL